MDKIENVWGKCKVVASCDIVSIQYIKVVSSFKYVKQITAFNPMCTGLNFYHKLEEMDEL